MTAQKYLAYTYLIGWTDQDRWYYGLRYENIRLKRTPEEDFWTYYKTSSKPVKQMRAFIGEPNYISIDKTFESIEEAIEYENQILTEMNVLNNDEWLNQNISGAIIQTEETKRKIGLIHKGKIGKFKNNFHTEETKKKIRNSKNGVKLSLNHKNNISKSLKGIKKSKKHKEKIKLAKTGKNNHMYGKPAVNRKSITLNKITYNSITEASIKLNVSRSTINRLVKKEIYEYK